MSRKILFTASTMSHIENFHLPYLKAFEALGWEVDAVALPVSKHFFSLQNFRAVFFTRRMLLAGKFDAVSSHATLAGAVTRLAVILAGNSRRRMKIFHTAHGYLFQDNKNLKKWAYLLPEILCGKITDVLMVMNREDLAIAKKYRLCGRNNHIHYIDGMGVDLTRFQSVHAEKDQKETYGIGEDDFTFVYAAEFSKRKNHRLLLKGFAQALKSLDAIDKNDGVPGSHSEGSMKLALAGEGTLWGEMKYLAEELGIKDRVLFLGYVKNIPELYANCGAAVTTSRMEGLPFNVMEAMAAGLPVIASDIKGHRELITHNESGLLFESENQDELCNQILKIYFNPRLREQYIAESIKKIQHFSIESVFPTIMGIYEDHIQGGNRNGNHKNR